MLGSQSLLPVRMMCGKESHSASVKGWQEDAGIALIC